MEKRTVIAVAVSMGIFIIWTVVQSLFFAKPTDQVQTQERQVETVTNTEEVNVKNKQGNIVPIEFISIL